MDEKLHRKIALRKEKGTLRSLSSYSGMIDFASNDYLGLAKPDQQRNTPGSTGSRLISGHRDTISDAEAGMARFFGAEAALCFNSGYDANIGIFSSVPQRGDVVLYDEYIHASTRDGIRLSLAKSFAFKHNDLGDLKRLLEKHKNTIVYVAMEGLYSMEGDLGPVGAVVQLLSKYNAYLILDEAHSVGVYGESGRGMAHGMRVEKEVFIRLCTFGKAYGSHGAVVLCSNAVKEYLVNFARSLIYTTALPESCYTHMYDVVQREDLNRRREKLQKKIALFRKATDRLSVSSEVNSPIQIIRYGDTGKLKEMEQKLKKAGIHVKAIYAPTVPEGQECLRVCLHIFNSDTEIETLTGLLMP